MRRAVFALALAAAVVATVADTRAAEPFDPFAVARIDGAPGARVPLDGALIDAGGRAVSLRTLARGRPVLLIPVQHRCHNICGATLEGMAQVLKGQGIRPGHDLQVVAFGIDPREGPSDAAVSARRLRAVLGPTAPAGIDAVTAAPAQVAAVADALGYRYAWDPRIGQYAHIAAAAVLTPQGRLSTWLYGVQPPPRLMHAAVAAAAANGFGSLGERLLLLCYHYEPATGRYDSLVLDALRLGMVLAVAALAGFVAWRLWRDRRPGGAA
jgi:protein SCO1/2